MTPEHVELVFDKFYRANPENSQISGLGLGMNIVKQIVEEHGGEISISSNLGEGTTVTFTLPLEDIASF
jgi:signal transduction histidine kinase